jgi:hypothetical protein
MSGPLQIFGAVLGFIGQQRQASAAKKARAAQEKIEKARRRQAELRAKRQATAAQAQQVNAGAAQGSLQAGSSFIPGAYQVALASDRGVASTIGANQGIARQAQNSATSGAMLSGLGGLIGDYGASIA